MCGAVIPIVICCAVQFPAPKTKDFNNTELICLWCVYINVQPDAIATVSSIDSTLLKQRPLSVVNTVKTHSVQATLFCYCLTKVVHACATWQTTRHIGIIASHICKYDRAMWLKLLKDLLKSLQFPRSVHLIEPRHDQISHQQIWATGCFPKSHKQTTIHAWVSDFTQIHRTICWQHSLHIWFEHILHCVHISMIFSDTCKACWADTSCWIPSSCFWRNACLSLSHVMFLQACLRLTWTLQTSGRMNWTQIFHIENNTLVAVNFCGFNDRSNMPPAQMIELRHRMDVPANHLLTYSNMTSNSHVV